MAESERWDQMPEPRTFPFDIYRALGDAGFIGYSSPTSAGGQGKSFLEYITAIEELAWYDPAFALMTEIGLLVTMPIVSFGSEALRSRYVPDCLSGKMIPSFAFSEPEAGSDAGAMKSVAVSDGDAYVISGEKMFITHGDVADLALVFARLEGDSRVSAFVVKTDQPGWQARLLTGKLGIRATTTTAVTLDRVRTPKDHLVGEPGKAFRYAMATLDAARIIVAAQAVGLCQRALDESVAYAKQRIAFGAPIAKLQAIQWMIADMSTRLEAARMLTYKAAQLKDAGRPFSTECAHAKLFASESASFCIDRAMQIHAGYGYIGEFSCIEKLYRDQRFLEIGEGTSEIQRMVIAGRMLT